MTERAKSFEEIEHTVDWAYRVRLLSECSWHQEPKQRDQFRRVMSRRQAKRTIRGDCLREKLEHEGINVRAGSMPGLAEEAPQAYKNVSRVVETVSKAGIAHKVARLRPIAVVKG